MQSKMLSTFLCSAVVASCVFADVAKSSEPNSPLITGGGGATSAKSLNSGLSSQALGSQALNDELSSPLSNGKAPHNELLALNSATQPLNSTLLAQNSAPNAASKGIQAAQEPSQILLAQNELSDETLNSQNQVSNAQIPNTYQLGAVEITAQEAVESNSAVTTISAQDIKHYKADNVGDAIRKSSGIFYREGANWRQEPELYIRGFDRSQIGLYIDGIPVDEIYGRATDYTLFTTQGIDSVQISKGFTSPVYGLNNLGGAINMVSRKPQKELEVDFTQKLIVGRQSAPDEVRQGIRIGTKQDKFYLQLDASNNDRNFYSFASDYVDFANRSGRNGYYHKSRTLKLKAGWTPNENHEYSLNYIHQKGSRFIGIDESTQEWPFVDKDSVYFLGDTFFTPNLSLNTRLFYHTFTNRVIFSGVNSDYDDDGLGGILTLNWDIAKRSNLKFGANVRRDTHIKLDPAPDTKVADLAELTSSVFTQYAQGLGPVRFVLAGSYDRADTLKVDVELSSSKGQNTTKDSGKGDFSLQGVVYFDFDEGNTAHLTVGKKQNLPSLSSRYSTRQYNYMPNPDLKPENAINYEVGYDLKLPSTTVSAALFFNDMKNIMSEQVVYGVNECANYAADDNRRGKPANACLQRVNLNYGYTYGGEIAVEQGFFADDMLVVGANYSYIQKYAEDAGLKENDGARKITDYPNHMLNAKVVVKPLKMLEFVALASYESAPEFYDSATNGYSKGREYISFDLSAEIALGKGFSVSLGAFNIADRDNYIGQNFSTAYHLQGRTWFAGVDYKY